MIDLEKLSLHINELKEKLEKVLEMVDMDESRIASDMLEEVIEELDNLGI